MQQQSRNREQRGRGKKRGRTKNYTERIKEHKKKGKIRRTIPWVRAKGFEEQSRRQQREKGSSRRDSRERQSNYFG